jgi:hypothetical protein
MMPRLATWRAVFFCAQAGAALLVAAVASCSGGSTPEPGTTVRDSAGIRIVENDAGEITAANTWTLSPEPVLEIGGNEDDSTQILYNVFGSVRLSTGAVVVANAAPPALRWYDASGTFVRGAGRAGGGPGEFTGGEGAVYLSGFWPLAADSVGTWEHPMRRMQVFDEQGRFARAVTLALPPELPVGAYPQVVGRMGNGGFVAFIGVSYVTRELGAHWRDTLTYLHWNADGVYTGRIAELPGFQHFTHEFMGRTSNGRAAFSMPPVSAVFGDRFFYGSAGRFEISVYDTAGAVRTIIRRGVPRQPLTSETIAAYKDLTMKDAPPDPATRRAWQQLIDDAPYPDSIPAYRRIRVDREGALWVQEYDLPGDSTFAWHVFHPDGRWLTRIETPRQLQIHDIGRDWILGLMPDAMEVERIRLYTLRRGPVAADTRN